MSISIQSNISALHAERVFEANRTNEEKTTARIAAGTRIASAADDAAGLAVSSQMHARNRSSQVAVRNIQDGISFVQVAEGGLHEITQTLTRFRELAIQASSDTISDSERSMLNREVVQLRSESDRIAQSSEFNGSHLLAGGGSWPVVEIQTGLDGTEGSRIGLDRRGFNVTLEHLGLHGIDFSTKDRAREYLSQIDDAISTVSAKRANLGSISQGLEVAMSNAQNSNLNHEAARSRIQDADLAYEVTELSKSKVLTEASTSILAQANQDPKMALRLLQD